jgi:DNA-directed RNA polymerase specialized sigma24 family protein
MNTTNTSALDLNFEEKLKSESKALRTLAIQLTRNSDDAKDLVQETYLKALRYKDKLNEGSEMIFDMEKIRRYIWLQRKVLWM